VGRNGCDSVLCRMTVSAHMAHSAAVVAVALVHAAHRYAVNASHPDLDDSSFTR
jgi:hypothetical protein